MKEKKVSKGMSIGSLICGVLGLLFFLMPYVGLPLSVLAMVFYTRRGSGNGIATSGLVTGIVGTVINGVMLFLTLFVLLLFGTAGL